MDLHNWLNSPFPIITFEILKNFLWRILSIIKYVKKQDLMVLTVKQQNTI